MGFPKVLSRMRQCPQQLHALQWRGQLKLALLLFEVQMKTQKLGMISGLRLSFNNVAFNY